MGYVPEPWRYPNLGLLGKPFPSDGAPALNLDRHGMPRDYATYVWLLYRKRVEDRSPARRAFLQGGGLGSWAHGSLGATTMR
jgi:hypothetical protein